MIEAVTQQRQRQLMKAADQATGQPAMSDRYLAPIPKSAPTRVGDRLLRDYLATPIGSPEAQAAVIEAARAHHGGQWEHVREPDLPKKERRRGKGVGDLTDDERHKILSMYSREFTLDQIAQAIGGSVGTVNRFLDAEGVERRTNRVNRMRIEGLIRNGDDFDAIADREGCSVSTVRRIAKGIQ